MNQRSLLESDIVVYHGGDHARRGWLAILLAAALTLGMFALLPFADQLSPTPVPELDVRSVTVQPLSPPATKPHTAAPPETAPPSPVAQPPEPALPPPPAPAPPPAAQPQLAISLDLDLPTPELQASLSFPVQAPPPAPDPEPAASSPPSPAPAEAVPTRPTVPAAPARPTGIFAMEAVDKAPLAIRKQAPTYPPRARWRNVEGVVELRFVVTTKGQVEDVDVLDATPPGTFDASAIAAIRQWRFEPGQKNGFPVATRMTLRIRFELD